MLTRIDLFIHHYHNSYSLHTYTVHICIINTIHVHSKTIEFNILLLHDPFNQNGDSLLLAWIRTSLLPCLETSPPVY